MGQKLFYNGNILTMAEVMTESAVLTENGRILFVGSFSMAKELAAEDAEMIDLQGKTMLPGFIDGHSHITAFANTLALVNLNGAKSFDEMLCRIEGFIAENKPEKGQWIMGFGYDHNFFAEGRHPDRFVLDKLGDDYCIAITHASGHMGVLNSRALSEAGVNAETKDIQGGVIGRIEGSTEPNGYLEEAAFMTLGAGKMPAPEAAQLVRLMAKAQDIYFSYGITTIQDGMTKEKEWQMLELFSKSGQMKADMVAYVDIKDHAGMVETYEKYVDKYDNHLKIGGYKLFLDGSPQGRTAWMSAPYQSLEDSEKPEASGYCGYPIYTDAQVEVFMETAVTSGHQILVHCNGDAAAEQMLRAYKKALNKHRDSKPVRPVMVHAQLARADQMKDMAEVGMLASFFIAHTYYWGDIHLKNFGRDRAQKISSARTAQKEGVVYTFHQDTPVILPDMLETIWCAVNRKTREGIVLGEEEKISVTDALKAVTINAAYQYFEEDEKGSIEAGKKADFVILDKNPLEVPKESLRDIHVVETIKDGETVFRA